MSLESNSIRLDDDVYEETNEDHFTHRVCRKCGLERHSRFKVDNCWKCSRKTNENNEVFVCHAILCPECAEVHVDELAMKLNQLKGEIREEKWAMREYLKKLAISRVKMQDEIELLKRENEYLLSNNERLSLETLTLSLNLHKATRDATGLRRRSENVVESRLDAQEISSRDDVKRQKVSASSNE
jgi:hypothetical protein